MVLMSLFKRPTIGENEWPPFKIMYWVTMHILCNSSAVTLIFLTCSIACHYDLSCWATSMHPLGILNVWRAILFHTFLIITLQGICISLSLVLVLEFLV